MVIIPQSSEEATVHALSLDNGSDHYQWSCPDPDGKGNTRKVLEMHVSEEDFVSSMGRDVLRHGNALTPAPVLLVEPDNPYVRIVAEHIISETEGYGEYLRAVAALNFVQTAIIYQSDEALYGAEDYSASPTETLFLHMGDCEDTSVLLCSLFEALGYESVLLDYDGHVAVGLVMDGRMLYCETTDNIPTRPIGDTLRWKGQDPNVMDWRSYPAILGAINRGIAAYRNLIQKVTGT